jgi:hypothetical protein
MHQAPVLEKIKKKERESSRQAWAKEAPRPNLKNKTKFKSGGGAREGSWEHN